LWALFLVAIVGVEKFRPRSLGSFTFVLTSTPPEKEENSKADKENETADDSPDDGTGVRRARKVEGNGGLVIDLCRVSNLRGSSTNTACGAGGVRPTCGASRSRTWAGVVQTGAVVGRPAADGAKSTASSAVPSVITTYDDEGGAATEGWNP
jgi:hypothetical protein